MQSIKRHKPDAPVNDALERKRAIARAVFKGDLPELRLIRKARTEAELDAMLSTPRAEARKRYAVLTLARRLIDEWGRTEDEWKPLVKELKPLIDDLNRSLRTRDPILARDTSRAMLEYLYLPGCSEIPAECYVEFANEHEAPAEVPEFVPLVEGEL